MDRTLAIFLQNTFWQLCFTLDFHPTICVCLHDFDVILRSFWGHFETQNGLMDLFRASGLNLGARGPSNPKFHHFAPPIWDSFWTIFAQVSDFERKNEKMQQQILVFVISLILKRFLIDFEVSFGGQKLSNVY